MSEVSPNDGLTPYYYGERLVYIPTLVFYIGELAIKAYIEGSQNERTTE